MTDFHHHQHRPHRISVPPRTTATSNPIPNSTFPYSSSTPTPTPSKSKHRLSSFSFNSKPNSKSNSKSISFIFLLLFSLRSLYSLFPFLRSSSPSFSLFPFSFLVSLLSFFLTLSFSLFSFSSSRDAFLKPKQQSVFGLFPSITNSQQRVLILKSVLLALVFLLRFSALRYCSTAAMIIAEFMGTVTARRFQRNRRNGWVEIRGFVLLFLGLFMLSFGWDRAECFPLSRIGVDNCVRVWQLLLPFMSGFLACYEQCVSVDSYGNFKQLDRKRVRLVTLFFTTIVLFVPAVMSYFVYEAGEDSVSFGNLAWPLANTVVFGVLLSENCYSGDDWMSFKDSKREFLVMFMCTLILELFYYPDISLWGLLICGLLLYVAVRDLDSFNSDDIMFGDDSSQFLTEMVMKPIRHILSERKSRKIALFLLINAGYMVVEFVAGFMSNSLGLISDACHMLFDCAALAIGLYASYISRLPANNHYNYGRGRFEVLSGYTNAVFLVLVGALIVVESFERILDPQEISTSSLLVVSIGGLVVNVIGLIFFHEEHHHAHGMSGSCSHSHPHSHSVLHNHDQHHHHESNREIISVSSNCQDNSCSGDLGHHNHSNHERKIEFLTDSHSIQSIKHHNNDHHDHNNHADHNHHAHTKKHDHHDHNHHADHHDHHTGHLDHNHHAGHLDHDHHAGHHDHNHHASHHDHSECHDHNLHDHDHHHHHNADHHSHDAPVPQKQSHRHIDHNMEGIFLHVLADTLGSVGVVISTLLIKYKGWLAADPVCSIFISVLIISSVIPLLRNSAEVLLQRIPRAHEHDLKDSLSNVLKIKGVYGIQKFHSWSFTNTDVVGTLHLHVSTDTDKISVRSQVSHLLHNAGIKDLTLQVECVR
ncbi:uncharacterized protein LOC131653225 [Vicia villosa]|uniref:uncharacterized protein LOC131633417 n=1 Tax=Vicia villosa TaxID=3911 RepID=UPI00273B6810|nr:uncharacterized protein LOC131633417 [Vicia villosa]XP_058779293.1 uncharacterized protein LOC131653225 [Vicia villosa]